MKYLIHARPSQEFIQEIKEYKKKFSALTPQSNEYRTTLMVARFNPADETKIIDDLEKICAKPITIRAGEMELFTEETLVIKLVSPDLKQLHHQIIEKMAKYIDWQNTPLYQGEPEREGVFKKYGSQFCEKFYQPHIIIVETESAIFRQNWPNMNHFAGITFTIDKFYLSRKQEKWETAKVFPLK